MYIIELFFKLKEKISKFHQGRLYDRKRSDISVAAEGFEAEYEDMYEKCEHIFGPVDSTNTVLACVKCGFLIHCSEDEFKKKNIFKEDL